MQYQRAQKSTTNNNPARFKALEEANKRARACDFLFEFEMSLYILETLGILRLRVSIRVWG
ncbi:hypothetical protein BGAL_0187g00110 [Botrytis galanthina]|uniref:Uncharacterized protein n=1 Tax=Botrytis galanthina TaxID=278940 RepID=A0A4S8QYG8_9HELO|nr:hypothetical protein BGAL_0187g00110 [Botrytis galanthina]